MTRRRLLAEPASPPPGSDQRFHHDHLAGGCSLGAILVTVSDAGVAGPTLVILGGLFLFWAWLGWLTQRAEDAHPPDPNARVTARWSDKGRSYSGALHVARSEYFRRYRRHLFGIGVVLLSGGLLVLLLGVLL